MKHYLDLVSISASIRRRQNRMIRICITLSVFLTAVMFGLADMFLQGTVKGQTPGSGAYQIYQVAFILALIVMLTSVLMISSGLNSSVAQRTRFFGMLRCLGATRKQIKRFVRYESLYLCKTAVPAGIILSVVVVWILSAAMRAAVPYWFASMPVLGISWISIFVSTVLGIFTVLLASGSPAGRAAKSSPLEAVSGNAQPAVSFRRSADTHGLRIETALGIFHAHADRKNYLLMTGSFAVCISLFLTFTTLVDFMRNAVMPEAWAPDLSVVSEDNTCSIPQDLLDKACQNDTVKRAYGRMFAYNVPITSGSRTYYANLISYEEHQFHWAAASLEEGSMAPVMQETDQILFVRSDHIPVHAKDQITLAIGGRMFVLTVAGVLSDSPLAREEGIGTIFCSEDTFTALTGETGYTILDIQFRTSAAESDVAEVEHIFTDCDVSFHDQFAPMKQQRNLYYAFAVLVYGFLSIIVAVTIFHIMNVVRMGASARKRQYGIMRAIGMSKQQLVKSILAEAAVYAVSGTILGYLSGIPLHWVVFTGLITSFWGKAWTLPLLPLGIISGIIFLTTALAVRGPAKQLCGMTVIQSIGQLE